MVLLSPGISLFPQLGLKRGFVQVSPLYKSMVASSLLQNKISLHSMWLLGMVIMSLIRWVSVLISILIEINDAFFFLHTVPCIIYLSILLHLYFC